MKKKIIIIATSVLCILGFLYIIIQNRISNSVKEGINDFTASMSDFADITYAKSNVNLLTASAVIQDVKISPKNAKVQNLNIKKIVIRKIDENSKIPLFMKISFNGIQLENLKPKKNNMFAFFSELLTDENFIDIYIDYTLTPVKTSLSYSGTNNKILVSKNTDNSQSELYDLVLKDFKVNINKLGSLRFLLEAEKLAITDIQSALRFLMIKKAELQYTDNSLITTVIESIAKHGNTTREDVTNGLIMMLDGFAAHSSNEKLKEGCNTMSKFIEHPQTLSISITPNKPIAYSDFFTKFYENMFNALNLKVKVW